MRNCSFLTLHWMGVFPCLLNSGRHLYRNIMELFESGSSRKHRCQKYGKYRQNTDGKRYAEK